MRINADVNVTAEDSITAGHKPGIIRIDELTLFFPDILWGDGSTLAMEALRDECQSQLDAIKAQRAAPVSAPADPEPVPLDAPIEQIAAPYMTPAEVLPQGQPVEVCWRCKGSGQRSLDETMGSPGDHPCPACRPTEQATEDAGTVIRVPPIGDDTPF